MTKLVYILNHYHADHTGHANHVIHFLEQLAQSGVDIVLVIERGQHDLSVSEHFTTIVQRSQSTAGRIVELWRILTRLRKQGYHKTFTRISNIAGVVTSVASRFTTAQSYFWKSGETLEFERQKPLSLAKLRWYLSTYWPLCFTARFCTYFVTGPEQMKHYYQTSLGVPGDKIKVLYNDVDLQRFQPVSAEQKTELRKRLDLPVEKKIILFSHRFSPVRRTVLYFPQILAPLADEADLHLCFIGDGPEKDGVIDSLTPQFAGRMTVLDAVPNSDIHTYYQAADLFMNPSYAEGFPRVILEAMACGLPIVTTDAGGVYDILGPKQQHYITKRDAVDAFGTALHALYTGPALQAQLLAENQERVRQFATDQIVTMFKRVILDEDS